LNGLYSTFELIAEFSSLGRAAPDLGEGLRRFEHGRHSIFYTARSDMVVIGRVIDNRRDMRRQFRSQGRDD
jgi:plasmid stabilization system protein ParE